MFVAADPGIANLWELLELLSVKAELEKQLGRLLSTAPDCGLRVHSVAGLGVEPGHWAHQEPAPHHSPVAICLTLICG